MAYPDGYATAIARWLERHDGSIVAGSYMPDWYYPYQSFHSRLTIRGYGCSGGDELSEISIQPLKVKYANGSALATIFGSRG
jgi:hypothetical protein